MKSKKRPPPENCPNCGEDVSRNAQACPGCGSDYQTGWNEENGYEGLDLPGEDFDYDEFTKREFGHDPKPTGMTTKRWVIAVVITAVIAWLLLFVIHR